jgi:redox-sensitive bicupin YhaK (pirin superfamily)
MLCGTVEHGDNMGNAGTIGTGDIQWMTAGGRQLNEPIAWGGPIVMNTQEELQRAFRELDQGTFIKKK